jgi:glutamine amidotransferase
MAHSKITIIDYGLGNLFNVQRALESVGASVLITDRPQDIFNADRLVLPGVGAFGEGMKGLKERNLLEPIYEYVGKQRPMLGICLGMQLMMEQSEELGVHRGLGLIKGKTIRFQEPKGPTQFKIPHIGWNRLNAPESAANQWTSPILKGVAKNSYMYFLHSFHVVPSEPNVQIAQSQYGHDSFCAAFQKDHIFGFQPHPERSAETGLQIFRNFVSLT